MADPSRPSTVANVVRPPLPQFTKQRREPRHAHPRKVACQSGTAGVHTGTNALPATRVYLKPHYLPRERPYWRAREAGQI